MENEETSRGAIAARAGALLDRAEFFYLRILRAAILIVATVLLIYALWLGISSLYKMSRSPSSVVEVQANVAADELTGARLPAKRSLEEGSDEAVINPEHKNSTMASPNATTLCSARNSNRFANLTISGSISTNSTTLSLTPRRDLKRSRMAN